MKASQNGSSRRERRHFSGPQKAAIVKSHLVDGVAVSDLCDQHQILPTQLYQWQKQLFENGGAGFLAMTGLGLAVRRRRQGGDRL